MERGKGRDFGCRRLRRHCPRSQLLQPAAMLRARLQWRECRQGRGGAAVEQRRVGVGLLVTAGPCRRDQRPTAASSGRRRVASWRCVHDVENEEGHGEVDPQPTWRGVPVLGLGGDSDVASPRHGKVTASGGALTVDRRARAASGSTAWPWRGCGHVEHSRARQWPAGASLARLWLDATRQRPAWLWRASGRRGLESGCGVALAAEAER